MQLAIRSNLFRSASSFGVSTRPALLRYPKGMTTNQTRNATSESAIAVPASTTNQHASIPPVNTLRYVDIGINLSDATYQGSYHGRQVHEDDTHLVVQRATQAGCLKLMVTGSDLHESQKAIELAEKYTGTCYATVGVHPCSAKTFDKHPQGPADLLEQVEALALDGKERGLVTAFGEIGLDYDRLHYADKETQLKYFESQLVAATRIQLPLFLHSRAAGDDFERLIRDKLSALPKRGLVHSFTGTMEEMQRLVSLGLDIGINGCSMKTEENIEVVRAVPLDRMQIETDGPWCEMRATQASAKFRQGAPQLPRAVKKEKWEKDCMVKGRNEPITISHVAYAIAQIKGIAVEEVCEAAWKNSVEMFGLGED